MAEAPSLPSIEELDELGAEGFVEALAPLFEGVPGFIARLALDRPFGTYEALLDRARVVASTMPEAEQIALLDAHPRIGAPPATVSALSFREQGYDRDAAEEAGEHGGLAATTDEEAKRQQLAIELERLNAAYEARFGFRFVIQVAGLSRTEIATLMGSHLAAGHEEEKLRALREVVSIARERLERLARVERAEEPG